MSKEISSQLDSIVKEVHTQNEYLKGIFHALKEIAESIDALSAILGEK